MKLNYLSTFTVVCLGLLLPGIAPAVSIYQWQDSNGVTHFSDEPPAENTTDSTVRNFEVDNDYPLAADPEDDYYSISKQWERANEDRQARMKLKLEKEKIRASQAANQQEPEAYPEPRPVYYPVYSPGLNGPLFSRRFGNGLHVNRFHSNPARQFKHHGSSGQMNNTSQPTFRGSVGNVSR